MISGWVEKGFIFDMPDGIGIEQAQEFARVLDSFRVRVGGA
jgi:hypothetical protein